MRTRGRLAGGITLAFSLSMAVMSTGPASSSPAASGDRIADGVLGQPGFTTGSCNLGGRSATSECEPIAVTVDPGSGRLYVSEDINRRVVSYPSATAFANGAPADIVFGQPDFATRQRCDKQHPNNEDFCHQGMVGVDRLGNVYITDRTHSRVMEYDDPVHTDTVADRVFGAPDLFSGGCNEGGISAATLCEPRGITFDAAGNMYVADEHNNRLLIYLDPLTHDNVADMVIGPSDFDHTGSCSTSASTVCSPRGVDMDANGTLWVGDAKNNRVLAFLDPIHTDGVADLVLGQPTFTASACNNGGVTASSMCEVREAVAYITGTQTIVYVTDNYNSRVPVFFDPFTTDRVADSVFGQRSFTTRTCNAGGISDKSLCHQRGIGIDSLGNLYVPDTKNSRLLRFDRPFPTG
jgi:NHL repeat-containing protein